MSSGTEWFTIERGIADEAASGGIVSFQRAITAPTYPFYAAFVFSQCFGGFHDRFALGTDRSLYFTARSRCESLFFFRGRVFGLPFWGSRGTSRPTPSKDRNISESKDTKQMKEAPELARTKIYGT